ncbi:hypothetical protein TARUN_7631 [Trichoderma arundinaceum]|uniref:DUF7357 domain-containing protein n=1 Tax=Trichoderma arundinaceum TaxID=490622 RepID=A0A395NFK4_TRIAR|nr:hypothetical protein TARUN_7631 [Trichoderma arundinaceum]
MQPQDIRLRLVIRRHGLPEVKLVWPCSCSEDLTISKVLEQVNEVVPLESGEWGLEDYAVELADGKGGTFECLHFQQVGRILKDEDQVLIRSLLTGDLKRRRLSGRHQISDDGRHLVDGLAFGRSWVRAPRDRPQIELPPRKRVRITYDAEDDDEEQEQFLLEASRSSRPEDLRSVRILDHHNDDEDDSQDYEDHPDDSTSMSEASPDRRPRIEDDSEEGEMDDYTDEEGNDGDLETELRLLREDAGSDDYDSHEEDDGDAEDEDTPDANLISTSTAEALMPSHMMPDTSIASTAIEPFSHVPVPALIQVFRPAFPVLSNTELALALMRANLNPRKAFMSLDMLYNSCLEFNQMMDISSRLLAPYFPVRFENGVVFASQADALQSISGQFVNEIDGRSKLLIEEVKEIEDSAEDSTMNGVSVFPTASNLIHQMSSDVASDSDFDSSEAEEDASGEEESESDSESDSSDDSLDNDSSSDEEGQGQTSDQPVAAPANGKSEDLSSNESSSDDDSDDSSGSDAENGAVDGHDVQGKSPSSSSDPSSSDSSDSDSTDESGSESEFESESESDSESESGSESGVEEISSKRPVQPQVQQQTVAATAARPDQVQPSGTPQPTGLTRTQKRNARRKRNKAFKELQSDQPGLATNGEGGAMSGDFLARKKALLDAILNETHDGDAVAGEAAEMEDAPHSDVPAAGEPQEMEMDAQNEGETEVSDPKEKLAKRHSRVDLGAGRRLVFGALGLKTPKSKADEQDIRNSLMKDVRPLVNPRAVQDGGSDANAAVPSDDKDEDPDAWREKIIYKAVECCHENMTLSEPPFPFVQRWDPQQKYDAMRKRKRASENYQADTSYDDSAYYYDDEVEEDHYARENRKKSKKKKGKSVSLQNGNASQDEQDVVLNYDEAPIKSSQFTDADDLPSLPKDVKTLPLLERGSAQPGMVITWNQLVMSKATKWQPEMLPITGLIVPGGEDDNIHVILARRDREDNERVYDEVTGERIYDKFEVPDLDEANEEEDTGFRSLQWAEMIEPRLLQRAPSDGAATVESEMPPRHVQVSEFQREEDALESRFSTGQVRAAIEDDLMHDSFGTQANLESISIQSGQRLPRLDQSMSEVQISTASNSFEHLGHLNSNNLSRAVDAHLEHALTVAANPQNAHSPNLNRWTEREGDAAADQEAELGNSLADAMAEEVSNSNTLTSKMTQRSEEEVEEGGDGEGGRGSSRSNEGASSMVSQSNAIIASSQFSIPSGRQPRTTYSIEEALQNETIIPETLPQLRETTPTPDNSKSQATPSSPSSSSPFPSLEQIFMSAQPTQSSGRRRETPSLSASQSLPVRDVEYEEAMRKLDEGNESDAPPAKKEEEDEVDSKLFPNATQPSLHTGLMDEGFPAAQISLSQSEKRIGDTSPFVIPAGSQVIILSSSPASSGGVPDEDNGAEYDGAGLGQRRGTLPTGPGWVRKGARHGRDTSNNQKRDTAATTSRTIRRRRSEKEHLSLAPLVSAITY